MKACGMEGNDRDAREYARSRNISTLDFNWFEESFKMQHGRMITLE